MHLLIAFAACSAPEARDVLADASLPSLGTLLSLLSPQAIDAGESDSLTPPHKRVFARLHGLTVRDGCTPWAAWHLACRGVDPGAQAWAQITPCHARFAGHRTTLLHPDRLALDAAESRELMAALVPAFEDLGISIQHDAPGRWFARAPLFDGLPSASLYRAIGQDVARLRFAATAAPGLRTVQDECADRLADHPVNRAREHRGALTVNTFWVSGTGRLEPGARVRSPADLVMPRGLESAVLSADWHAYRKAWTSIDATEGAARLERARRGADVTLTLCGERSARSDRLPAREAGSPSLQPTRGHHDWRSALDDL